MILKYVFPLLFSVASAVINNVFFEDASIKTERIYNSPSIKNNVVQSVLEEGPYSNNTSVALSGTINCDYFLFFDYTENNLDLNALSFCLDDKTYFIDFRPFDSESSINIMAHFKNDIIEMNFFCIDTPLGYFVDDENMDNCYEKYYCYLYSQGLIDSELFQSYLANIYGPSYESNTLICQITPLLGGLNGSANTLSIQGTIYWSSDVSSAIIERSPLRNVKVELVYGLDGLYFGEQLIESEYTTGEGFYSFELPSNIVQNLINNHNRSYLRLKILSATEKTTVGKIPGIPYEFLGDKIYSLSSGSSILYDVVIKNSNIINRAIEITQPLYWAQKYVEDNEDSSCAPYVNCIYPNFDNCGSFELENVGIVISKNSYNSWDEIIHEYGHWVQFWKSIVGQTVYLPNHTFTSNYANMGTKTQMVHLIWQESWPSVFALLVTKYFEASLSDIKYELRLSNNEYNAKSNDEDSFWSYNLEKYAYSEIAYGELGEGSTAKFLFDLFDEYDEEEPFDNISLGHHAFWNIITSSGAKTFYEFYSYLMDLHIINENDVGSLLRHHGFAIDELYFNVTTIEDPFIEFDTLKYNWKFPNVDNLSSLDLYNCTEEVEWEYKIYFFDIKYKFLFDSTMIINSNTYHFDAEQIEVLMNSDGSYFYAKVACYSNKKSSSVFLDSFWTDTGPYFSDMLKVDKPRFYNQKAFIFPDDYSISSRIFSEKTVSKVIGDNSFTIRYKNVDFLDLGSIYMYAVDYYHCSFIEYESNTPFYSIGFNLSYNGNNLPETYQIEIYTKDNGYYTLEDVIDNNSICLDFVGKNKYRIESQKPHCFIKIVVKSLLAYNSEENCICLGTVCFDNTKPYVPGPLPPYDHQYD